MRQWFRLVICSLILCLSWSPLAAEREDSGCCCCETTEGIYLGIAAGGTWWHDTMGYESDQPGVFGQFDIPFGWNVAGSLGYRWCSGWRAEFETAYRQSDIDGVIVYSPPIPNGQGTKSEWETTSLMFNLYHECVLVLCGQCWRPFFGFGIGTSHVSMHTTDDSATFRIDGDDWVFAYQLMAGWAFPVTACVDISLEYCFFNVAEITLDTGGVIFHGQRWTPSHSFMVSAKWIFASF